MTRNVVCLYFIGFATSSYAQESKYLFSNNYCNDNPYELVWSDEFNGNNLDRNKWATFFDYGVNPDDCIPCFTHDDIDRGIDAEGQIYEDNNVSVSNGQVALCVERETATVRDERGRSESENYTSGMIWSNSSFTGYMKVEARIRMPSGRGLWPAFWMWTGSTEFDIFEGWFYDNVSCSGSNGRDSHYSSGIHNWEDKDTFAEGSDVYESEDPLGIRVEDLGDQWRVYSMEYSENFIDFRIDGTVFYRVPKYLNLNTQPVDGCYIPAGFYIVNPYWPNQQDALKLIANVAVFDCHSESLRWVQTV